eukprot:12565958-Prorocentrum_lima.AAC.1
MTSSLVGSEMCIRDSLQSELHQARSQRPVSPKNLDARIRIELENRVQACLLYTSDAADDM